MAPTSGAIGEKTMSNEKILLTAAEVATLTGFAEGTIRHFVSQRRIPVVRISARCVRFRRSDIDLWLEEMLIPSITTRPDGAVTTVRKKCLDRRSAA
jgi:excisionase family DNA binding protein